jgi:hypothetical protein
VTLATAPVDPLDLFSGAYVRLAYEVERPPPAPSIPSVKEGETVYLVVERAEPAWRLVEVATEPPAPMSGRAALRARWHAGRLQLESAGRLYLTAEKAKAAEGAMAEQRRRRWETQRAAEGVRQAVPAGPTSRAEPAPAPEAFVDLRVDEAGNLRVLRLRVGGQVFGE